MLCGIMAHFGLTQYCVGSKHTFVSLNIIWDHRVFWHHSILCRIIALNIAWDHSTFWHHSILWRTWHDMALLNIVGSQHIYFGITHSCVGSWHTLAITKCYGGSTTHFSVSTLRNIVTHFSVSILRNIVAHFSVSTLRNIVAHSGMCNEGQCNKSKTHTNVDSCSMHE